MGEELVCSKEESNLHDPYSVCVKKTLVQQSLATYQGKFLLPVFFFLRENILALLVQLQGANVILLTFPKEDLKFHVCLSLMELLLKLVKLLNYFMPLDVILHQKNHP